MDWVFAKITNQAKLVEDFLSEHGKKILKQLIKKRTIKVKRKRNLLKIVIYFILYTTFT